jgi:hypothetical protein
MKKSFLGLALILGLAMIFFPLQGKAQMGPWMMGRGYGYGYGMGPGMMGPGYGYGMGPWMMGPGYGYGMMHPWMMGPGCGYGMGPWMMGRGRGYHMGPGMMGWGYGMGPWMMGPGYYGSQYGPQKPLDSKEAKETLEDYLKSIRNPNLKVGKIEDKGNHFEVNIVTKDNDLVDKIDIDKNTGWMRSEY